MFPLLNTPSPLLLSVMGSLCSAWCSWLDIAAVLTLSEARLNLRFLVSSPIKLMQLLQCSVGFTT